MKKLIFVPILAFAMLFMVGCSKNDDASLKIGVLNIADSVPLFIGDDTEAFKKAGLDVKIIPFASAGDQIKAFEAGKINALMTDLIVLRLLNNHEHQLKEARVAIGSDKNDGRFVILGSPNGSIKDLNYIDNKKIGISENTMMEFLVDSYFDELGVDTGKVEKINMPALSMRLDMLLANNLDMAILPEPLSDLAIKKGANVLIDDRELKENLSESIIAVSDAYIKNHSNDMDKFLKVYDEIVDNINNSPDNYREKILLLAHVPEELKGDYVVPHFAKGKLTDEKLYNKVDAWLLKKKLVNESGSYKKDIGINE